MCASHACVPGQNTHPHTHAHTHMLVHLLKYVYSFNSDVCAHKANINYSSLARSLSPSIYISLSLKRYACPFPAQRHTFFMIFVSLLLLFRTAHKKHFQFMGVTEAYQLQRIVWPEDLSNKGK